ncbi:MAG: PT domain-containing protein, partial [Clostridia bacterium]|nr:PT domain-containing protein [Clostridia bacterium]
PTAVPTAEPTAVPTAEPTAVPTATPVEIIIPTTAPTLAPTEEPTAEPTEEPTAEPTEEPTPEPTEEPTPEPTEEPTPTPKVPYTEPTWEMIDNAVDGVLIKSGVNMRQGPSTSYPLVASGLKSGTEVTVYLEDSGFYFLRVNKSGKFGYIAKQFVDLSPEEDDDDDKPARKATEEPSIRLSQGDVNGDGLISAADAALILRYDAGLIDLSDAQLKAADMDGDDEVTDLDAKAVLKYVVGRLAR